MSEYIGKQTPISLRESNIRMIYSILKGTQIGEEIRYEDLLRQTGYNVRDIKFSYMLSGARDLLLEEQIAFGTIRGVGLVRLNDNEIVESGDNYKKRIRTLSKKGIKTLAAANYNNLDEQHKLKYNRDMSLLGAMEQISSPQVSKRVEACFEPGKMDYHATLKQLGLVYLKDPQPES